MINTSSRKGYWIRLLALVVMTFVITNSTSAVDVRLRYRCECNESVVRLSDVADIVGADQADQDRLNNLELFPTPREGGREELSINELRDQLSRRGVNLFDVTFSGASECLVTNPIERAVVEEKPVEEVKANRRVVLGSNDIEQIRIEAGKAIAQYLSRNVASDHAWLVDVQMNMETARSIAEANRIIAIKGGAAPWFGQQRFELTLDTIDDKTQQRQSFWVDAKIDEPATIVIARQAVSKGHRISQADVELQEMPASTVSEDHYVSINSVIGLEALQTIPANRPLTTRMAKRPFWVKRSDIVTLYSRAPGISVKIHARATEDGCEGDLIAVQTLDKSRRMILARVCNIQEVEIFSSATQAQTSVSPTMMDTGLSRYSAPGQPEPRTQPMNYSVPVQYASQQNPGVTGTPYRQQAYEQIADRTNQNQGWATQAEPLLVQSHYELPYSNTTAQSLQQPTMQTAQTSSRMIAPTPGTMRMGAEILSEPTLQQPTSMTSPDPIACSRDAYGPLGNNPFVLR